MTTINPTIAVLGNCQAGPLRNIVSQLAPSLNMLTIKAVHTLKPADLEHVYAQIELADIIVHQPIGSAFGEFSIDTIKERFPKKQYISFPSIYFAGYFPNLMYVRKPAGGTLPGVIGDYHDARVLRGFLQGNGVPVQEIDLPHGATVAQVNPIDEALGVLRSREQGLDIRISGYLDTHVRAVREFYVMNHPSNAVLLDVAEQLLRLISVQTSMARRQLVLNRQCYLSNYVVPVELGILPFLDPGFQAERKWAVRDAEGLKEFDFSSFIRASYELYSTVPDLAGLFQFALRKRQQMEIAALI